MEEIETKSYNEQSSEDVQRETDDGKSPRFKDGSICYCPPQIYIYIYKRIYFCVHAGEEMSARAPAQRAIESLAKGRMLLLLL